MNYSISVEHISKKYSIGRTVQTSYPTLREAISSSMSQFFRGLGSGTDVLSKKNSQFETLWALQDISFQARPGEVLGIVGKNGAGKSTLLKILSRITEPSQGSMRVRGRLASLLEVGTGFHPELTGRENVFLNGALLGMKREEIRKKFDEIVAFSQIEKFVDTPVKRYSSGMYVRLAFSVAAHLDPDVLVLDEVLAVGDLAFQKKCLNLMKDVAHQERTILFVSHNLHLIRSLCSRVILLDQGKLIQDGPCAEVLPHFIKLLQPTGEVAHADLNSRALLGNGEVRIEKIHFLNQFNQPTWNFSSQDKGFCEIEYSTLKDFQGLSVVLFISNPLTEEIITTIKEKISGGLFCAGQRAKVRVEFPQLSLRPGEYSVQACLMDEEGIQYYDRVGKEADIPLLSITSAERDPQKRLGYFSLPAFVREG